MSNPAPGRLLLVGVSHRTAPVGLRERLHVGPQELGAVAAELAADGEAVVLSTCNRVEVYAAAADLTATSERIVAGLARRAGLAPAELLPLLERAEDEQVAVHLLRVAAGLESLVPGEPQILGQVREAHRLAGAAGATGPLLDRLFRQALETGKRVRAETRLAEQPASVATAAAQLARRLYGSLAGRRVLVIGAGKMSEIAAASLVSNGVENVFIANRTPERAAALAARFGGQAVGFDRLLPELELADVVVSSTRCPRLVLSAGEVARALVRRHGRPLLLIDIAVPRDLDPAIRELGDCRLYDIDDLGRLMHDVPSPATELARAQEIVAEERDRFAAWRRTLDVVPAIASLRRHAEEIRAAQLAAAEAKLSGLSAAERRAVETVTARIVNKLLHAPTMRVKQAAELAEATLYAETLRHLFALEEAA